MKITVLGSGGWGIALALTAYRNGHSVMLWSPFEHEVEALSVSRESSTLLSGVKIPEEIGITTDIGCAENRDILIIAVPSVAVRETARRLSVIRQLGIVVNVAKGLEAGTYKRLSEVITDEIPARIVVLSGPSHAEEVSRMVPTSIVAASTDHAAAEQIIQALSSEFLRIYTNDDMVGAEIGGALKNIIAVAAGFCDGMGFGDNTRAALITRGLAEIARLGMMLGGREQTFAGLTGLGDLVVTCTSRHSRNHRFGMLVGQGTDVQTALKNVGTVEGYFATRLAHELAEKVGAEMPIINQCYGVLYENRDVTDAVRSLMLRPRRDEHEALWMKD